MMGLLDCERISMIRLAVLIQQITRVTDGQTDGQSVVSQMTDVTVLDQGGSTYLEVRWCEEQRSESWRACS